MKYHRISSIQQIEQERQLLHLKISRKESDLTNQYQILKNHYTKQFSIWNILNWGARQFFSLRTFPKTPIGIFQLGYQLSNAIISYVRSKKKS